MVDISYTELARRTPLWLYANNRDLVVEMPNIIGQAEEQLLQVMDHDLFQTVITGKTVGPSSDILDMSAETPRILEVRAMRIKYRDLDRAWIPIFRRDIEMLSMLYPDGRARRPQYYAEYGGILKYRFFPYPDAAYDIEVTANVKFVPLSATVDTNILTDQYPRAIEKATFRQAALFMKDMLAAQTYEKEMMSALSEANAQTSRRRRDVAATKPRDPSNKGNG